MMIVFESVKCKECGFVCDVSIKARQVICPMCTHKMIKVFITKYCKCSHRNIDHDGFDEYESTRDCNKCICTKFENVKVALWNFEQ